MTDSATGTVSRLRQASLQWIERSRNWSVRLGAIFLCCAAITFGYFATYPRFQAVIWGYAQFALLLFTLSAPLVLGGALFTRGQRWIAAASVHAALYAAFMVVLTVTFQRGHSLGDSFAGDILKVLWGILVFELFLLLIAIHRSPSAARETDGAPWLFTGLTAALLGGWVAGVLAWSETVPARIVAAAESAAGDKPYCLVVNGRAVSGRRYLTGLSARAARPDGYAWDFHAVLVAADPDKTYSNWSYKTDRFELIRDSALNRQYREQRTRCEPAPHFASNLK